MGAQGDLPADPPDDGGEEAQVRVRVRHGGDDQVRTGGEIISSSWLAASREPQPTPGIRDVATGLILANISITGIWFNDLQFRT